jgi:adenine phosphoribosyltransferase
MASQAEVAELAALIRDVPDFPKKGILFKDITTLLKDPAAFRRSIDLLAEPFANDGIEVVVGMESRGFIFAAPLAYKLGAGFIPVRKLGRLPAEAVRVEYSLEYGSNILEMHRDAIEPGQRVLVVDDLLATGGTVQATIDLVEQCGGQIAGIAFLVELLFLNGRERLRGYPKVVSIIEY